VLGFLTAAHRGDNATAARYLRTRKSDESAEEMAQQLFVVLDRRLPAKLNELSERPEGSQALPADPNLDLVGTIDSSSGRVQILIERVKRSQGPPIWLFSSKTLAAIPDLYQEVNAVDPEAILPAFLVDTRILRISLFEWLALLAGLPLLYLVASLLNWLLRHAAGILLQRWRQRPAQRYPEVLPAPVRLLLLALAMQWAASRIALPLVARQLWSRAATMVAIAGGVWVVIRLNRWGEGYIYRRYKGRNSTGVLSIARFARRAADVAAMFVGVLVALHYLGMNVGAALAGLGVGGIAVALAAQKTLENVIGGVSLVMDQTVRVGDWLKVADTQGTVEHIGLRSIRIRTSERTVVSVPNGQVANASLEDFAVRDKFWFHHIIGLRYGATAEQVRAVVAGLGKLLSEHSAADRESVAVRLLRFGASSMDVEVFAYLFADNPRHFLEMQGELLLRAMEVIEAAGAQIALPSQIMHIAPSEGQNAVSAARV